MGHSYALDFGFDLGDSLVSLPENPPNDLAWGIAQSTDGGPWRKFQQQRETMEVGSILAVRLFNISDQRATSDPALANPVLDAGGKLTSRVASDSPVQRATKPWGDLIPLPSGRLGGRGDSDGMGLTDLPMIELCRTNIGNEGHFAITLEFSLNGMVYIFREDPELVIGGGSGSGN